MIYCELDKCLEVEDYLKQQCGNVFFEIFYIFFQFYMVQFVKEMFFFVDECILVIWKDLGNIIYNFCGYDLLEKVEGEFKENGLVILVFVIIFCLQIFKYCDFKLVVLEFIFYLVLRLSVEIFLDWIILYFLYFSNDFVFRVRVEVLRMLIKVFVFVKEVFCNDINIYLEYILLGIVYLV